MDQLIAEDPHSIGPYRLIARLGEGGMGLVYLGRSEGGRTVAVKVVQAEYAGHPEFRRRFAREVAAARRVGGSCTAAVLDADPGAAVPWVATQYIPGPDLHAVVARQFGPLPEYSVHTLANRLALALRAVHEAGLIHRDLKPSNVLVTVDGPRVIDFGIARAMDSLAEEHSLHTRTGMLIGSPGFMSPEQVRGLELTPASDVFCLGAVLVYAATGRLLFGATDTGLNAHLFRVAEDEADLTGVPDALLDLVRDCLHKDPARRPTPAEVARRTTPDQAEEWLPGAVLAQLGRHAARLLDYAPPAPAQAPLQTTPQTTPQAHAGERDRDGAPARDRSVPLPPAYAPTAPAPFDPSRGFGPPPGPLPAAGSATPVPGPGPDGGPQPPHPRRWWGLAVIALAQLLVLMQAANFTMAIPAVQADLHLSYGSLGPMVDAYYIAFGAVLLIGGHLADLVGRKQTLVIGLFGCAAAAALAGSAGDSGTLTAARVLQGAFGALLTPAALALVADGFTDPRERGRAFGVYAAIAGGGTAFALAVSGWLLGTLAWRVSLYAVVPLAVIALIGAFTLLDDRPARTRGRFDPLGVLLGSGGVAALTYGLSSAPSRGWATPLTLILLGGSVLLLVGFVTWQIASADPMVASSVFRDPSRLGSLLSLSLAAAATFTLYLALSTYLQAVCGFPPQTAGLAMLPMVGATVIGSTQVSARLLRRTAPRVLTVVGLVLTAVGLLLLTGLEDGSYASGALPGMVLAGLGIGIAFVPVLATATGGGGPERSGGAAGAVTTAQEVGTAFGAALLVGHTAVTLWWAAGAVIVAVLIAALTIRTGAPRRPAAPLLATDG
ncbi:MDR family MFS transporter [Streptomyces sp. NPDC056387]|uniref:MDR family MFS transporter n=1 Tax=Streptomyces sp. NPDC056387 TaxID=3345803 RepID=UPI0035D59871